MANESAHDCTVGLDTFTVYTTTLVLVTDTFAGLKVTPVPHDGVSVAFVPV